jgi:hypothetical protein
MSKTARLKKGLNLVENIELTKGRYIRRLQDEI